MPTSCAKTVQPCCRPGVEKLGGISTARLKKTGILSAEATPGCETQVQSRVRPAVMHCRCAQR
jgi:hypothetical protein